MRQTGYLYYTLLFSQYSTDSNNNKLAKHVTCKY